MADHATVGVIAANDLPAAAAYRLGRGDPGQLLGGVIPVDDLAGAVRVEEREP
jgi:hypothetical protein